MKYKIMVDNGEGLNPNPSNDLPGIYLSKDHAQDVINRYSNGNPKAKVKYFVQEVAEDMTATSDLEAQLHKVLGELIAVKEERNKLKEQLAICKDVMSRASGIIGYVRFIATSKNSRDLFGNSFARIIMHDTVLEKTEYQLHDVAAVIK